MKILVKLTTYDRSDGIDFRVDSLTFIIFKLCVNYSRVDISFDTTEAIERRDSIKTPCNVRCSSRRLLCHHWLIKLPTNHSVAAELNNRNVDTWSLPQSCNCPWQIGSIKCIMCCLFEGGIADCNVNIEAKTNETKSSAKYAQTTNLKFFECNLLWN